MGQLSGDTGGGGDVGPALDDFDKIYQKWRQCRRCLTIDGMECGVYSGPLVNIHTNGWFLDTFRTETLLVVITSE